MAQCLNASIRLAGGLVGRPLSSCVRRNWLYFPFISEALSCVPFSFGWKFRNAVYKQILSGCGDDTILHFGVTLEDERTRIGRNVWVSVGSYIDYAEIGDSVLIGPHAVLLAGGAAVFVTALFADLTPTATVAGLAATGQYDSAANTFTANRIAVLIND